MHAPSHRQEKHRRLPHEASVEVLRESGHRGRPHGRPSGLLAVAQLARDLSGLRYDPDATFRVEAQRILERSGHDPEEEGKGLYGMISAFQHTEISFEISSDLPPIAQGPSDSEGDHQPVINLTELVSRRIRDRALVTTGLLGDYRPDIGRVVLYNDAISQCADKLALRPRHVGA